jgi:hypothetical protein
LGCKRTITVEPDIEYGELLLLLSFHDFISVICLFAWSLRFGNDESGEVVYIVTVRHPHHERCAEMADQQILNPSLREWFEGLMAGGLTATQALSVYEEAVFGGTPAGESELLNQQVLCPHIPALY